MVFGEEVEEDGLHRGVDKIHGHEAFEELEDVFYVLEHGLIHDHLEPWRFSKDEGPPKTYHTLKNVEGHGDDDEYQDASQNTVFGDAVGLCNAQGCIDLKKRLKNPHNG